MRTTKDVWHVGGSLPIGRLTSVRNAQFRNTGGHRRSVPPLAESRSRSSPCRGSAGVTRKLIRSNGTARRRTAYARERCVQIELAPRNAGTDSRDRHGETEKGQRRAHARHAYRSGPSQSRTRSFSVAPVTCSVAHRVSLASVLSPSHAARPRRFPRRPARRPRALH